MWMQIDAQSIHMGNLPFGDDELPFFHLLFLEGLSIAPFEHQPSLLGAILRIMEVSICAFHEIAFLGTSPGNGGHFCCLKKSYFEH
jgi:hypothetical protein